MNTCNLGVIEDHAMLDVSVNDGDAIANARIRPDISMFEMAIFANDYWTANFAANNFGACTN